MKRVKPSTSGDGNDPNPETTPGTTSSVYVDETGGSAWETDLTTAHFPASADDNQVNGWFTGEGYSVMGTYSYAAINYKVYQIDHGQFNALRANINYEPPGAATAFPATVFTDTGSTLWTPVACFLSEPEIIDIVVAQSSLQL